MITVHVRTGAVLGLTPREGCVLPTAAALYRGLATTHWGSVSPDCFNHLFFILLPFMCAWRAFFRAFFRGSYPQWPMQHRMMRCLRRCKLAMSSPASGGCVTTTACASGGGAYAVDRITTTTIDPSVITCLAYCASNSTRRLAACCVSSTALGMRGSFFPRPSGCRRCLSPGCNRFSSATMVWARRSDRP